MYKRRLCLVFLRWRFEFRIIVRALLYRFGVLLRSWGRVLVARCAPDPSTGWTTVFMEGLYLARIEIIGPYPSLVVGRVAACRREFVVSVGGKPEERILLALAGGNTIMIDPTWSHVRDVSEVDCARSYFWINNNTYAVVDRRGM